MTWNDLSLFARRTVKPYRLHGRTVAILVGVLTLVFLLLVLIRIAIQGGGCPTITVRTTANQIADAVAACGARTPSNAFATGVIDNLAAGLIVAAVSTLMVWLVSPKAQVDEDIAALEAWNIRGALDESLSQTRNYWFRGRSGRFMRTTVMPSLHKAGAHESQLRTLSMLLPDPADTKTLAAYALYRKSLASETRQWTVEMVQAEIIATILTAARLSNGSHFFHVNIFLKSDFALFRLDMSDNRLIMTREDPSWPAIMCSGRSKFYASYHEEFRNEAENGTGLDLSLAVVPADPSSAEINPLVAALGIGVTLSTDVCDSVIEAMKHPTHPYA